MFGEIGCRPGGAHLVDQMNYTCDIDLFRESARAVCQAGRSEAVDPKLCAQVTLGILERRLTARSNRRGELSQGSSGHIRRDLELMSTLRGVEQGVCSGYLLRCDAMTAAINDLQDAFAEDGSEIETGARDDIAAIRA